MMELCSDCGAYWECEHRAVGTDTSPDWGPKLMMDNDRVVRAMAGDWQSVPIGKAVEPARGGESFEVRLGGVLNVIEPR